MKVLLVLSLILSACNKPAAVSRPAVDATAHAAEIEAWRARRIASLKSPDGWLSLAGLFWIEEGKHTFGSDKSNNLVFPASAPAFIGSFSRTGHEVRVDIRPGVEVLSDGKPVGKMVLKTDAVDDTTELTLGSLTWYVIEREENRMAIRLRDHMSPLLKSFAGIDSYPIDASWKVEARIEPYNPPKKISIPTIYGTVSEDLAPGALVFEINGQTHRLDYIPEGTDEYFVIFGDITNQTETYQPGRYVYVKAAPANGTTFIDFNQAYNPPCVFTDFATCPLPPKQNKLPIPVTAGEKRYRAHAG
jgi:uncharacterized protein (DUF1684 family)